VWELSYGGSVTSIEGWMLGEEEEEQEEESGQVSDPIF